MWNHTLYTAIVSLFNVIFLFTAKCIASLASAQPHECEKIVRQFMMDICSQKSGDSIRMFALLSIGEIGIMIDLSSFTDLEKVGIFYSCFHLWL